MKGLLIVDVQNDFCPGGALATPQGDKVVPVINKMMDRFDWVLASRDWHPPKTVHFEKWPPHCIRETYGAEWHPLLDTNKIQTSLLKGTGNKDDGYSAFEATNIDLTRFLKDKGIDELYVCGLTTEFCVKESAIDAAKNGFKTFAIKDAIEGVRTGPNSEEKAFEEMQDAGVSLTESISFLK
jgi:nicotinamidase/pyrazinamidase